MENYFNYFTEIEEHFQRRRGSVLLLSTLDWALIETWKDAGIPLEAVLKGIDAAFDHFEQRPSKTRKVNGLAYCSQEVLGAAEDIKEAAVGANTEEGGKEERPSPPTGFEGREIAIYLLRNADRLEAAQLPEREGISAQSVKKEIVIDLRRLAEGLQDGKVPVRLEDLERQLTVLEEKLNSILLAGTAASELVTVRADADRDLAPYRRKMIAAQIEQLQRQYVQKKLLDKYGVPRLSLFYM